MVVAASADLFDGWIARRFNQTSDWGTMLDPFADKFMHCMAILSLVIVGNIYPLGLYTCSAIKRGLYGSRRILYGKLQQAY